MSYVLVGLGGFFGAVSRFGVYQIFGQSLRFPYATLIVNVVGCALIGFLFEWASKNEMLNSSTYLFLTTGFLGAFTTFSAFGLETINLLKGGSYLYAALNIIANVTLGSLAVLLPRLFV